MNNKTNASPVNVTDLPKLCGNKAVETLIAKRLEQGETIYNIDTQNPPAFSFQFVATSKLGMFVRQLKGY